MNEKLSHLIYTYLHFHMFNKKMYGVENDFIFNEVIDFLKFSSTVKIIPNNYFLYLHSIGISHDGHFSILFDSYEELYSVWIKFNKNYIEGSKTPKYIINVFDKFGNFASENVKKRLISNQEILILDEDLQLFLETQTLTGGSGGDVSGYYPEKPLELGLLVKAPIPYTTEIYPYKVIDSAWLKYSVRPSPDLSLFSVTDFVNRNNLNEAEVENILSNESVKSFSLNPFHFLYTGLLKFSTEDFKSFAEGIGIVATPSADNPYHFSIAPKKWYKESDFGNNREIDFSASSYLPFGFLNDFYQFLLEKGEFISFRYDSSEMRAVG